MYAAGNTKWRSPALFLGCVGPSLRCAVTAHVAASVSCCGKRRCGRRVHTPVCGTDAAFGLVGYLRRDDMVPMSRLHRQLACKVHAAASDEAARPYSKVRA